VKSVLSRIWVSQLFLFRGLHLLTARALQGSADVWLTVPAAWDARGCQMMRDAAITAGLVQSSRAGDRDWRDRLRIITYGFLQLKSGTFADRNTESLKLRLYIVLF
jgi:hypothetical protein